MSDTSTYTAFRLANMAGCACPDSDTSAGASFLLGIELDYRERKEYGPVTDDVVSEIADGAPNVYNYQRWQQFVDLAAWQEDVEDLAGGSEDMTTLAGLALYMIAERLVQVLVEADSMIEDEDEDEDEG